MYRLTIDIGVAFTSASYELAAGSEALQLSPSAAELPSTRSLTEGWTSGRFTGGNALWHGRHRQSAARRSSRDGPGDLSKNVGLSQLLLLWEALVLAGIPDASVAKGRPDRLLVIKLDGTVGTRAEDRSAAHRGPDDLP
jgi:hypothetical protein